MRQLFAKGLIFLCLNGLLAIALLYAHAATLTKVPWETDSILLTLPQSAHRDVVMLGTSRTYLFSRFEEHHAAMETALERTVFNMALPQGGGITPARFYLERYFEAGNTTDRVVYFLDPFVLYSAGANDNHKFVYFEPFQLPFLGKLLANGYPYRRIITYGRSKFSGAWLFQQPQPLVHHIAPIAAEEVTEERIALRLESLYPDGLPERVFDTYTAEFERIVALCESHETPLTVIVPPTLLGPEPGHATMMAWLQDLADEGRLEVHDWVHIMPDRTKYYNLDHMNLGGIETFMNGWMRPLLDGKSMDK